MGFVKESKIHPSPKWGAVSNTWASWSDKFPDTVIDSFSLFHQPSLWRNEEVFNNNTFSYMGRNTDNDVFIEEDNLHWENLTDYYWNRHLNLENEAFSTSTVNWEGAWQEWEDTAINDALQTLDGNWESKVQTDRTETIIDNQFFKYSWAGIDSTWDSLT